jgi:hypothetical protein
MIIAMVVVAMTMIVADGVRLEKSITLMLSESELFVMVW